MINQNPHTLAFPFICLNDILYSFNLQNDQINGTLICAHPGVFLHKSYYYGYTIFNHGRINRVSTITRNNIW